MKQKVKDAIIETVGIHGIALDKEKDLISQLEKVDPKVRDAVDKTLSANYSELQASDKVSYIRTFGSENFYKLRHRRTAESENIRDWTEKQKAEYIQENGIDSFKKLLQQNK